MSKKEPSKRALERRALQELYRPATLFDLTNLLDKGNLNLKDLRKYYTDARSVAKKSVERIQQGMFPFTDEGPVFLKTSELSDEALLRAVADINLFLNSPTRLAEGRKKTYEVLLEDLHSKGMTFLKLEDLTYWDRFRKWLRAANILGKPYASGDILGDIFAQSIQDGQPNSEYWKRAYEEVQALITPKKSRKRTSRRF